MKKKNVKLGKLTLTKSSVASLVQRERIMGGSGVGPGCNTDIECTVTCNCLPPPPRQTDNCNTQFPICQATDGFTCGPVCDASQRSCDPGGFLCDAGTFGGGGF